MYKKIIIFFSLAFLFLPALSYSADTSVTVYGDISNQLQAAAGKEGADYGGYQDPRITANYIIRWALTLVGTVLLCITIYSGVLWMTAGGNEDQVTKAKKLLYNSVIGLIIVLSAYSITAFAYKIAIGNYGEKPVHGIGGTSNQGTNWLGGSASWE